MTVIQDQKTFGFTGGSEVEAAVGALYKGTPGIYGALFDTAIATATETIATLRTSAAVVPADGRLHATRSSSSTHRRTSWPRRCSWRRSSSSPAPA